ncbi:MAG: sigma 54-interacting transcriptional regulator [Sporomusaceae bacterium]|nr:sigma 54-interacting transcriptional regulator [Sporomusaceae bacterium]
MLDINETLTLIFETVSEGILIIDKNACIVYGNKAYCDFFKIDLTGFKGRPLRDLQPGAILPNVLTTKKTIWQAPQQGSADIYFVNMYPIFKNGEVVGGISIISFTQQANGMKKLVDQLKQQNKMLLNRIAKSSNARYTFDDIVAVAPASVRIKGLAARAALTDATVFLQSESGTGKELYAQAIHNAGARKESVFLSVNCANFNQNILESELFGYVSGAFTGAKTSGKIGLFEAASGGTVFLDEISEMELSLQSKLLRVLQEQRVRPVGAVEERPVNVRVIAACNANLKQYIEEGRFRADLFYRLNVFPIQIPPLRERPEDIGFLVDLFLEALSRKFRKNIYLEEEARLRLLLYHWPGNVRELRNVLEFTSYLTDDGVIHANMLPDNIKGSEKSEITTLHQRVKNYEKNEIMQLLKVNGNDIHGKRKTAAQLGISLASLYNKINQ